MMAEESGMVRLTRAILALGEEERWELLKTAFAEEATSCLLRLATDLPADRRERLADLAEEMAAGRGGQAGPPEPDRPPEGERAPAGIGDRKHRRIPFERPVECEISGKRVRGVSLDISVGGMFLANTGGLDLAAGQRLQVTFYPPGEEAPVEAACEVVRVAESGIAIRFVGEIDPGLAARIGSAEEKN